MSMTKFTIFMMTLTYLTYSDGSGYSPLCQNLAVDPLDGTDMLPLHFLPRNSSMPIGLDLKNDGIINHDVVRSRSWEKLIRDISSGNKKDLSIIVLGKQGDYLNANVSTRSDSCH